MSNDWREYTVSPDGTHHLAGRHPAYEKRFDEVLSFHEPGLAAVRDSSGGYHIDTTGGAAYDTRYIRTFGFYEARAAVQDVNGWGHILVDGTPLYRPRYTWCGNFQEGLCPVRHTDGLYGHIRADGTAAYPEHYRYAGDFRGGIAVVQREDGHHTHVDTLGNPVHGRWFENLDVFHKGYARARDRAGWHHVDREGRPVYGRRFSSVEPFYNGQARVEDADGSLLVIDESGKTVVRLREPRVTPLESLSADMVGFWRTQTIRAVVELGVFETLPERPSVLEKRLGLATSCGERLLRALMELDLCQQQDDGRWVATERGCLLEKANTTSMAPAASLWGSEHYMAWQDLALSLRSGRSSFENAYGQPFFEWLASHPGELRVYQDAMSSYAHHDYACIPGLVDFSGHRTVLDAGGGQGGLLFSILRSNPQVCGILMDRPEVAKSVVVPQGIEHRLKLVPGDLFGTWPEGADAVLLTRVLHDWPDDRTLAILRNARSAIDNHGRLYLMEMVLDEDSRSGGMLDLNMLVMTGGRERTRNQFEQILSSAGFQLANVIDTDRVSSIIVADPAQPEGTL